jgi:hypothetical protein
MNPERRIFNTRRGLVGQVVIATLLACLGQTAFAQYIGAEGCLQSCHTVGAHEQAYRDWSASGHPHILATAENAMKRPILLPDGLLWEDIGYVIGGFKRKSRYVDPNGYIITSDGNGAGNNQFNYLTGEFSDYHAGEANLQYDCGSCHTTGYNASGQNALPGIVGTWEYEGVQCEACHGPFAAGPDGSQSHGWPKTASLSNAEKAAICGNCHKRGDGSTIEAEDGFIKHQQQYNEFLASPHGSMHCAACHDPHKRAEYSIETTCETCHPAQASAYMNTSMYAAGVECIDCHMAMATLSAQSLGQFRGDMRTHLFWINTSAAYQMITDGQSGSSTESGSAHKGSTAEAVVALDDGKGALSVEFACLGCHGSKDASWAEAYATDFHSTEFKITAGLSGTWWGGPSRDGEGWLIDVANLFVAAFYTYNNVGDAAWVIGAGFPEGNTVTVNLEIQDPAGQGPSFGADYNAGNKNTVPFGTATFTFTSCGAGEVRIVPNATMIAAGYEEIIIPISRVTSSLVSCPGTG